jgi:hypothetical protein
MDDKVHRMKTIKFVGLALVVFPILAHAGKKPKVPEAINQAHLVFVQAAEGEETAPGLPKQEVQAIANMRAALRSWGRYTLTDDRSKADLIFVVHKATRQSNFNDGFGAERRGDGGSGMGANPNDMPAPQGGQYPGQARDSNMGMSTDNVFDVDRLEVRQLKPNGKLGSTLWSRSMENGLLPPKMLLFAEFRDEVEKAYPAPAAAQEPAKQ